MTTLLLYNGTIYTLNPQQPVVKALAIRDGRILVAGSEGKAQAAVGGRVEGINLRGRAVLPGLTDAHVHITWHGLARQQVRLNGIGSLEQALERIADRSALLPLQQWLRGGGWDHTAWGRWPTRDDLDRVCPDRPVMLIRKDGHSVWVNSRALELAGIDDNTPDPDGGHIQRDEHGRATGILLECAQELVRQVLPDPAPEERRTALQDALTEALSYGLTSLHIPPSPLPSDGRETLTDLQVLRERDALRVRCLAHIALPDFEAALALGLRSGLGNRWLRIGGLKLFADGSLGSETAEMLDPYEGRDHTGLATMPVEELNSTIARANEAGISVAVHAIGDAANRKVLDAIERARSGLRQARESGAETPRLPLPNRIEHAQILHPRDIPRFAALGVVASMQPVHATSDMQRAGEFWGARCTTAYAWRALQQAGATLAFGSDAPVESLNPWLGIHAAVTRQLPDGTPAGGWYPNQRLGLEDALRGFCIGPALASGEAYAKGMLAPGMLADLAVLAVDPFRIKPEALHTVEVDMTLVEGQVVWERK